MNETGKTLHVVRSGPIPQALHFPSQVGTLASTLHVQCGAQEQASKQGLWGQACSGRITDYK